MFLTYCPGEILFLPTRAHLNIEASFFSFFNFFYPSIEYTMIKMTLFSMISLSFMSISEKYLSCCRIVKPLRKCPIRSLLYVSICHEKMNMRPTEWTFFAHPSLQKHKYIFFRPNKRNDNKKAK